MGLDVIREKKKDIPEATSPFREMGKPSHM